MNIKSSRMFGFGDEVQDVKSDWLFKYISILLTSENLSRLFKDTGPINVGHKYIYTLYFPARCDDIMERCFIVHEMA